LDPKLEAADEEGEEVEGKEVVEGGW